MSRERFDVVVYAPWASPLVGGSSGGGAAGGAETQAVQLTAGLAQRGLSVALVVIGRPGELPERFGAVRIVAQRPRRRTEGLMARGALALGTLRALAGVESDVVIQMSAGPTTSVVALAASLRGGRFIYRSASVLDFEFAAFDRRPLNARLYEWGVRRAAEIVVQNADQARLCVERFGREPAVINSIATPAEPRTGRPEAFLWVGRLQEVKRPGAYVELARAVPEAQFWMIVVPQENDPPDMVRALEEAVRELPNLHLLEPRPRDAVGELLDRTVAVVSTSEVEGLPNVFLEGWSRGVPALTLSFDPDGMLARHGLGSCAGGDGDRFHEEVRRLWRDRDDQREIAERCIAYVRAQHGADAVVERWLQAIERVRAG